MGSPKILSIPWPFLKSKFHCTILFSITFVLKYDYEFLKMERPTSKAREKRPRDEVGHFLSNCSLFWLEMCRKDIFCPNIAQKCKMCSRLPELQKSLLLKPEVF